MEMIMKAIATPATGRMLAKKLGEMYGFLAEQFECEKNEIGLLLKLEELPIEDGASSNGETPKPEAQDVSDSIMEQIGKEGKDALSDLGVDEEGLSDMLKGMQSGLSEQTKEAATDTAVAKTHEQKAVIYILVKGKAETKIPVEKFLGMMSGGK